ncbi:MAG: general secretion pathway protein GspK [Variovorax paradoxus]|uniref:Type II secretion system protein K n=1 Tax=Variovorax paradoxus TaxID=34073 RepID=A0A2W5S514_VARPD|nr:MAG: general secretion pathway protein GspK [Variovorax paradoxus]
MKRPRLSDRPGTARQRGAALLIAMLTVTLIATFAATALWQQWRMTEIEAAERARVQSAWVLIGALDWSRLILREDARAGGAAPADHLAEPWAVPLEEAKLTTFLAADKNIASDALEGLPDAFLSGQILDAQAKLNVRNLVKAGQPVPSAIAAFEKLFELLGLPTGQVATLANALRHASPHAASPTGAEGGGTGSSGVTGLAATAGTDGAPLMPQRVAELVWLGLPSTTVAALEPYVTVLPTETALNINTASAEALYASVPKLDLACARRLVEQRQRKFFAQVQDAAEAIQQCGIQFVPGEQSVSTSYFEVRGRLRLEHTWVEERSLLFRNGMALTVVWRQRGAGTTDAAVKAPSS